jgi:hypothetical protein
MNEGLTLDWLQRVWDQLAFRRRLLAWDAYRCHIMACVRDKVKKSKTDMAVIPGGLTSFLQPADVSWNKSFKAEYRKRYDEWMASGDKSFTKEGNMRQPDKKTITKWLKVGMRCPWMSLGNPSSVAACL